MTIKMKVKNRHDFIYFSLSLPLTYLSLILCHIYLTAKFLFSRTAAFILAPNFTQNFRSQQHIISQSVIHLFSHTVSHTTFLNPSNLIRTQVTLNQLEPTQILLSLSLTHSLTHSLSQTLSLTLSLCLSLSLSHTHTLYLSLSLSLFLSVHLTLSFVCLYYTPPVFLSFIDVWTSMKL